MKAYLEDWPEDREKVDSVLELLCHYYTVANSIDNLVIRARLQELNGILQKLSIRENDAVCDLVMGLCDEYIRQAFLVGACTGARLVTELQIVSQKG